ncbi:MAG: PAS domain-containing protein [Hyphomicrobiales bacterium]|nr:PAS domain-containing protein [Hyphomicrobiales bacterium]
MQLSVSKALHAYWESIRAGRVSPERYDVQPGAIRSILADTFILDFDNENGFPFRIAGSRTNALFMAELRGASFLQLWREPDREEIKAILRRMADDTQPYCLGAEAQPPGLSCLEIEATLFPLRHHGSTHARVLGSLAAASSPHWLGLISAGPMTLASFRALDGVGAPATASQAGGTSSLGSASSHRDTLTCRSIECGGR